MKYDTVRGEDGAARIYTQLQKKRTTYMHLL